MFELEVNAVGVWSGVGFEGTKYSVIPWGSLRKVFASEGGKFDGVDLGIVGSINEAYKVINAHQDTFPFEIDEWTGVKVTVKS